MSIQSLTVSPQLQSLKGFAGKSGVLKTDIAVYSSSHNTVFSSRLLYIGSETLGTMFWGIIEEKVGFQRRGQEENKMHF